ncbi:thiamine diphosphokinase [Amphibacillus sp. MSJ-3]|uniref:thiamine diphosphokinase n=1 Tax=Amphibacillus sp. MSJ-3 TaxID=2841505 RepID=UPI001C0EF5AE|nr:thiamine diphosphokinase [Amphibacillus sp. MSJ-3]MBU5594602.1 thiamine diphosphokinase [Amphibacillus sp. MSJ-3]
MKQIGIVAGGPHQLLANLSDYGHLIDYWIGCDRGSLYLLENHLPLHLAIGDFDSVSETELKQIKNSAQRFSIYPVEKDLTDLELAVNESLKIGVNELYIFGVTGGRKDHELSSIYLLEQLAKKQICASIVDWQNTITVYFPGKYEINQTKLDQKISFLSLSEQVTNLSLVNFYYPLTEATIRRGDSLTLSNQLTHQSGYFSFDSGILIVIKSSEHV